MAAVPPELAAALEHFRGDPPAGSSNTQTTSAQDKSTVERFDAAKPVFERWSRSGTAPKITDQLDQDSVELVSETAEGATYRSRVRPGESGDKTAAFLRATLVVHKPTHTIESIELASTGEFSPTFGVTIREMRTTMTSQPSAEMPSQPKKVETRVRGNAFWLKSLDADMTVTYSEFARAVK